MSTNPGPKVSDRLYSYDTPELHTERTRADGEEAEDLGQAERRMTDLEAQLDQRLHTVRSERPWDRAREG